MVQINKTHTHTHTQTRKHTHVKLLEKDNTGKR